MPATAATPISASAASWSNANSSDTQFSGACALLALMVQSQSVTQSVSKTDVEGDFKKMQELKQQLADAIQNAKDASEHSGFLGFLGNIFGSDIAELAGAVAAVAAIAATGGAAAPLVLIAVSQALELAAKEGAKLGLDPKICLAIGLASAAMGLFSGAGATQAAGTLADAARGIELGANLTQSGATVAGGALNYGAAHYQAAALDYQADAAGDHAGDEATSLDLDAAISLLQRSLQTEQSETNTASAMIKDTTNTNSSLCDRI